MAPRRPDSRLRAFAVALLFASLAAPLRAADTADLPRWSVDDTWTYVRTSFATPQNPATTRTRVEWRVVRVQDGEFYATIARDIGADGAATETRHRWSAALNYMNRAGGDGWQEFRWYQWPLAVGAQWETTWFAPAFGEAQTWHARVRGWETVTVPAGTFRALRVELENACFYKGVDGGICRQEDVVWYAPEARRHVRLERRSFSRSVMGANVVEELEAFHVR